MKIAFITQDGASISKHFGRASHYLILDVNDGKIASRELREKPHHTQHSQEHDHHVEGPHQHQHGAGHAQSLVHDQMASVIADCAALVCGGMGRGAYVNLTETGIKLILTDMNSIDDALQEYLAGRLEDRSEELLH